MFWINLPIELRVWILSMRHEMRKDAKQKIVTVVNFQSPKRIAKLLVYKERWTGGVWNDGI